jgi:two-component system chemotaxis sensor kinase CheA
LSDFNESEIEEFKCEAYELLDEAEKTLLDLTKHGNFNTSYEVIFRCFHNLKGAAGMMEWESLLKHTHEVETIFTNFKEEEDIEPSAIDFFLRAIDAARLILEGETVDFDYFITNSDNSSKTESKEEENSTPMGEAFKEFIVEVEDIIERFLKNLLAIEREGYNTDLVDSLYRDVHSLKGAAFLFNFKNIGEIAHRLENRFEGLRDQEQEIPKSLIDSVYQDIEYIEAEIGKLGNEKPGSSTEPKPSPMAAKEPEQLTKVRNVSKSKENKVSNSQTESESNSGSVRVPVQLLDKLMASMGEMVLVRNQVLQYTQNSDDLDFLNLSKRLNVVTSEIQEEMMKTRMQPVGNVVGKFHRVVRDLAKNLEKDIDLYIEGAETELDKSLLEAIKDPLTHIVRNACDHGLETIQERAEVGKSKKGNIWIRSYHEGGQVIIEVSDDGRGLNHQAILNKALEKGIITTDQANQMAPKQVNQLIFHPGFSTAAKVTNVSGRGVGMDVVATNIENIGGTVEIDSQVGRGTTFQLKIPLTLAIVPALIVNCGESKFAIPQLKLVELVRVDQSSTEKIEMLQGSPVFRLRGDILPLIDLKKVLNLKGKEKDPEIENDVINIAVVQADSQLFGLIVDRVRDTADIVVKPLNKLLKSLQVYSGATVLGDGSVALILDIQGINKVVGIKSVKDDKDSSLHSGDQSNWEKADQQDYLLVGLNSPTKYALVLNFVHRLEEFDNALVEISGQQRVIRYRGQILPLVSCNEVLGLPSNKTTSDEQKSNLSVIVVERGGKLFGLEVNTILDTLVTNLDVQAKIDQGQGVTGHLSLENELVVVVDPFEIISISFPDFARQQKEKAKRASNSAPISEKHLESFNNLFQSARILAVEDTRFFRKLIVKTLEEAGHKVTVAENGLVAMEILNNSEKPFDIIISDIEMPKMDGFRLASEVRKHPLHQKTPIMALSSKTDEGHLKKGQEAGFDCYMEKFEPEDLNHQVKELIFRTKEAA